MPTTKASLAPNELALNESDPIPISKIFLPKTFYLGLLVVSPMIFELPWFFNHLYQISLIPIHDNTFPVPKFRVLESTTLNR